MLGGYLSLNMFYHVERVDAVCLLQSDPKNTIDRKSLTNARF